MGALPHRSFVPTGSTKRKVYKLLMEGLCQADIARRLRLKPATISKHVRQLENEGFLERENVEGVIKTIGNGIKKGSKANTLDAYIYSKIDDTGVTPCSKKRVNVRTAKVHHLKYELPIYKEGDYQWITKETKIHNNTQTLRGKIPCTKGIATVTIFRTYRDVRTPYGTEEKDIKATYLYVYPPHMDLTAEEVPRFEEFGRELCNEVSQILENEMGWSLGPAIIQTNWLPHFAVETPYAEGLSEKFTLYSPDGKAWLSNSEGELEFEFSAVNQALTFLDTGRAVEDLQNRQDITQYQVEELESSHEELKQKVEEIKEEVDLARDERDLLRRTLIEEMDLNKTILEAFKQNNTTLVELHKAVSQTTRDQMQNRMQPEEQLFKNDTGGMFQ